MSGCSFPGDGKCPTKRFGRTELQMPVLTCGGMRFQAPKVPANTMEFCPANAEHFVPAEAQANVEAIVTAAMDRGINHFETAKYGCSELMLGIALRKLYPKRSDYILQTKVGPRKDAEEFRKNLQSSLDLLAPDDPDTEEGSGYIDLFAMHGINRTKELEWILEPGGCMDIAKEFQRQGKIKHIGFSTHGMSTAIVDVINCGQFDYVNLHYHYIGSYTASGSGCATNANSRAIEAAKKQDMGMFIISPYDKGGFLYKPSKKLEDACQAHGLHPIAFNVCVPFNAASLRMRGSRFSRTLVCFFAADVVVIGSTRHPHACHRSCSAVGL